MHGKYNTDINRDELLTLYETMNIKQLAEHYGVAMTTIISRLQKYEVYIPKKNCIEPTEENFEYLRTHTASQSASYFHCFEGYVRYICTQYNIEYIKVRSLPPETIAKKVERYKRVVKMRKKGASIADIAKKEHISNARVSSLLKYGIFYDN